MEDDRGATPTTIVCVGASAGGVDGLREFVAGLDPSFAGAVLVVLHIAPSAGSALDRILARSGSVRVVPASEGQVVEAGYVYVARPDHHLVLAGGRVGLSHGPRENGVRPAIDPLFRSAARAYGDRTIGVVLSGTGDDGTIGLASIKRAGGIAFVQDPEDAPYREMPSRAIEAVDVDLVGTPTDLAAAVVDRTAAWPEVNVTVPDKGEAGGGRIPSEFTCPDCGGTLYEQREAGVDRFVCRVGHSYSSESLLEHLDENLENVLWSAVRALEERADLARRMTVRLRRAGLDRAAERYRARIEESARHGEELRAFLTRSRDIEEAASE